MDHQKTGALIAQRRHQMGMTQKELAQKLEISDRTISKWERGAGFPDISLIEPLADALDLTVLELLHGQQEMQMTDAEQSVRETLHAIGPEVEKKVGRIRKWNILLILVLVIALAAAAFWIPRETVGSKSITAAEATAISPYILITGQDLALLDALSRDTAVIAHSSENTLVNIGEAVTGDYVRLIDGQGLELTYFIVQVSGGQLHVEYGTDLIRMGLSRNADGSVEKFVAQLEEPYPYLQGEHGGIPNTAVKMKEAYWVNNRDNKEFQTRAYQTGLAAWF